MSSIQSKLNQAYENINKLILRFRLSHVVDDEKINLHYMRSLKEWVLNVRNNKDNTDDKLTKLLNKANELLVIKEKTIASDSETSATTTQSNADLEGAAAEIVNGEK